MKNKKLSWKTAKRVLRYIGRYKILLAFSLLLAATSVAMTLYVPILIGDTVDIFATPSQGMVRQIAPILIKIAILVIATALLIFTSPKCNEFFVYLYGWQYALIFIGMILLTVKTTHNQIKRLFGESVKKSLKGGNAE